MVNTQLLYTAWNVDDKSNKISIEIQNEQKQVVNGQILLNQIPDKFKRVVISGMNEIDKRLKFTETNQFKVDYDLALVYFHPSKEGNTINLNYWGRGLIYIDSSRVVTNFDGEKITETLKDMVDGINSLEETVNTNEQARVTAESTRTASENLRISKEEKRVSDEDIRIANETQRIIDENTRKTNETARVNAEAIRQTAETTRQSQETNRQTNETARKTAETGRVTAEANRVTEFAQMKQDYQNATTQNTVIELTQARTNANISKTYTNLQNRLDTEYKEITDKIKDDALMSITSDAPVLPTNSMVDGILQIDSIKGKTIQNLLGDAGNCNDLSKWNINSSTNGSITPDNAIKLYGNFSFKFSINNFRASIFKDIQCDQTHKFFISANCYIQSFSYGTPMVSIRDYGSDSNNTSIGFDTTKINQWQRKSVIITGKANNGIRLYIGDTATGTATSVFNIDGIMLYDLTNIFGAGKEPTDIAYLEWLLPYVDGIQSVGMEKSDIKTIVSDYSNKTAGSTIENPNIARPSYSGVLLPPSSFVTELSQANYLAIGKLDASLFPLSTSSNGVMPQQLFSFNIIEIIERKIGSIGTTLAEKITNAKSMLNKITCNWWGYGSCPSGNKAYFRVFNNISNQWIGSGNNGSASPLLITDNNATSIPAIIDSSGFAYFLAYTDASDGVTASVINTDYINIVLEFKAWQTPKSTIKAFTINYDGKIADSVKENPNIAKGNSGYTTLTSPSVFNGSFSTNNYSQIAKLDSINATVTSTVSGQIPQQLFSFNVVEEIERRIGSIGATIAEKIANAKAMLSKITCNWHGFGSCPSGNKAMFLRWSVNNAGDGSTGIWSEYDKGLVLTTNTVSRVYRDWYKVDIDNGNVIDKNGFAHYLAYTDASDGNTASVINTDYVSLTLEFVFAKETLIQPTANKIEILSTGKSIFGSYEGAKKIVDVVNDKAYAYLNTIDGRNCLVLKGSGAIRFKPIFNKFKPNTQYTISVYARKDNTTYSGGIFVFKYSDGSTSTLEVTSSSWNKISHTTTIGKTVVSIELSYGDSVNSYYDYDTFMIEEGTTATTYTPYVSDLISVQLKEPWRSVPSVADEILPNSNKLVRRLKQILINDDTCSFTIVTTLTNVDVLIATPKVVKRKIYIDNYISDIPKRSLSIDNISSIGTIYQNNDNFGIIFAKGTTLADMKTWAYGKILIYELETPIEEELNLPTLKSFKGGSIQLNNVITPTITLKYPTNIISRLSNLEQEVDELSDRVVKLENALLVTNATLINEANRNNQQDTEIALHWQTIQDLMAFVRYEPN